MQADMDNNIYLMWPRLVNKDFHSLPIMNSESGHVSIANGCGQNRIFVWTMFFRLGLGR